jgi:hypothetical protein
MRGFIETLYNGHLRLLNINHIVSVVNNDLGDDKAIVYTDENDNHEDHCYLCDETYDEIKRKIEQAQPIYPWNLTSAVNFPLMHPNTEGDQHG